MVLTVSNSTAASKRQTAYGLSNNLARLLREFSKDFEQRIWFQLTQRGFSDIRPGHVSVFGNLGMGATRVTELAERARVTQQAMGKMLKELEKMGYISREVDSVDKRAKEITLTDLGVKLAADSLKIFDEVRQYYAAKIGEDDLATLEEQLRNAVNKLELEYLPESWTEPG